MKLDALDYTILFVSDLDTSVSFYRDVLGLRLAHQSGPFAQFATGTTRFALYERTAMADTLGISLRPAPEDAPLGHLFLTDVTCGPITVAAGQRVWARQLNIEGNTTKDPESSAKVDNDGGIVWILGLKTEDEGTVIHTTGGGRTELLGHRHVGGTGDEPAFVTLDSSLSAAITSAPGFPVAAVETRRGETRRANDFAMADLYSAWSHR